MTQDPDATERQPTPTRLGPLAVIGSVLAAAIGVQNRRNRERDFAHGNPVVFMVAGIVFTALFVLTLVFVVSLVVP